MIVVSTFYEAGEFSLTAYRSLLASSKQLAPLMGRSVLLSLAVTFLAMMVGTPLGVLLGKTDLPLRAAFTILLTLPLLVPPYVIAVAWFAVLESTGWIGQFLAPTTSEESAIGTSGPIDESSVWEMSDRQDGIFSRSDFHWDRKRGAYICPNGKLLKTSGTVHDGRTLLYR